MAAPQVADPALQAFLDKGCEFDGKLTFEGSVRIDGKFSGEIFTNDILIVGSAAHVKAEIEVGTVIISGKVEGNINAKKLVEIKPGAIIRGNIETPSIVIQQGAVLDGQIRMEEKVSATRKGAPAGGPTPVSQPA